MELREALLRNGKLTYTQCDLICSYFLPETYSAKQMFVEQGKISKLVGFIQSGMFRSFVYDEDGNDITTKFYLPGEILMSFYSFNNQKPARENIIALEDSELAMATFEKMKQLSKELPTWQQMVKKIDGLKHSQMMKRAIDFQTLTAKERYLKFCKKYPEVIKKVQLRHIASFLGINIATLSRIRRNI